MKAEAIGEQMAPILKEMGYKKVELIDTAKGKFMTPWESKWMGLSGSGLLIGRK